MNATIELAVVTADITTLALDVIVNAANSSLLGGGGVDGAIHRSAGPELRAFCAKLGGCPVGEARVSPGFRLPSRWVIHTVGPVWRGGDAGEAELLENCYTACLKAAEKAGARSMAFPAISTGAYGYPADLAAKVAVETVSAFATRRPTMFDRLVFCSFDMQTADQYRTLLPGEFDN